jgi:ribonuclease VapC
VILDTSALVAILFREAEAETFVRQIHAADVARLSVANFLELVMVLHRLVGPDSLRLAETFLRRAGVLIEPVTLGQGEWARQAFLDFGKGRHPAGLNFGDCFAYALAKEMGEPLLFKGEDFAKTDVRRA